MVPVRLRDLEEVVLPNGERAYLAASTRSRLLGLALLDDLPAACALLIPRCRSVHTFGMRFPLDVTFLDDDSRAIATVQALAPRRLAWHREAAAVLERRAGGPR